MCSGWFPCDENRGQRISPLQGIRPSVRDGSCRVSRRKSVFRRELDASWGGLRCPTPNNGSCSVAPAGEQGAIGGGEAEVFVSVLSGSGGRWGRGLRDAAARAAVPRLVERLVPGAIGSPAVGPSGGWCSAKRGRPLQGGRPSGISGRGGGAAQVGASAPALLTFLRLQKREKKEKRTRRPRDHRSG